MQRASTHSRVSEWRCRIRHPNVPLPHPFWQGGGGPQEAAVRTHPDLRRGFSLRRSHDETRTTIEPSKNARICTFHVYQPTVNVLSSEEKQKTEKNTQKTPAQKLSYSLSLLSTCRRYTTFTSASTEKMRRSQPTHETGRGGGGGDLGLVERRRGTKRNQKETNRSWVCGFSSWFEGKSKGIPIHLLFLPLILVGWWGGG